MKWVPHDVRDGVVDFVRQWSDRTELSASRLLGWIGLSRRQFDRWQRRFGRVQEHRRWVPRDHWLAPQERQAIVQFARQFPLEGYRRLTFMMLDHNVAAASPATVYRVLSDAGLIAGHAHKLSRKGTGFVQPLAPHEHWHIDFSYVNVASTFYYLCGVLDGASRTVLHWEIRESMKERDAELVLQRARELHPAARPRIISDNGPQFVARDFKEFIRLWQATHVRTSPYYPQSNGKLERFHRTLKEQAIRPKTPLSLAQARQVVSEFVEHYNAVRLHSAIGYVTPHDRLHNRHLQIFADRDLKLAAARQTRKINRQLNQGLVS